MSNSSNSNSNLNPNLASNLPLNLNINSHLNSDPSFNPSLISNSNSNSTQNLHPIYQTIYIELLILQSNLLKGIVDVAIENVSKDLSLILEDLSDKLFEVSSLLERIVGESG